MSFDIFKKGFFLSHNSYPTDINFGICYRIEIKRKSAGLPQELIYLIDMGITNI